MTVEPLSPTAPRPVPRAVFGQQWLDLAFVHWPVDPALVAPLLPRGTVPDVIDGVTWVGLVPFTMARVQIFGAPPCRPPRSVRTTASRSLMTAGR